jgi:flagellar hook assembly protein FlgD
MPATGKVTVDIFDVAGRRVRRVVAEQRTAGNSSASWDGKNDSGNAVGSGVYFVRVKTPSTQRFARITWLPNSK